MTEGEQYILSEKAVEYKDRYFTGSLYAKMMHPDGTPYGTFRTSTVLLDGDDCSFKGCTFENSAGPGKEVGQALALYVDADGARFEDCRLIGHQDTLFLAPLPPKEIQPGGFIGPKQFTPRTDRSVHFKHCTIEGGVDFIFGGASAIFEDCEFISVERGYVFAPSTPEHVDTGFVAINCRFTCTDNVEDGSCYIARPWRIYGKVRLENCYLGRHIHPDGFHDWNKPEAHKTAVFEEYGSYGPGAVIARRPDWVRCSGV